MAWNNAAKPSLLAWMNINPGGKEQYDQSNITYDEATVFYDGINPGMWSEVAKPSVQAWVKVAKPT